MTTSRSVLILAGGRGERFWPWSRPERPKQLLPLASGGRTLLAATVERAERLVPRERMMVLTAKDLVDAVRRECPGVVVVGEPVARNTAPALGAAAQWFRAQGDDPVFASLHADHRIEDEQAFARDLERGFDVAARERVLVTFGIPPAAPDTKFGYIRHGTKLAERLYRVDRFTEKPDRATAEQFVSSGQYAWNAGLFVWRTSVFLDALMASRPDIARPLAGLHWEGGVEGFSHALDAVFPSLPSIAVDYAVLEPAPNAVVIDAAFDWDDLGSWGAWARHQPHDARGNVLFGDVVAVDCDRCVIVGERGTAAAMGLQDMVVVHVNGATLTCRLDDSDRVREVSEAVRSRERK